jgi:hypothetical protein
MATTNLVSAGNVNFNNAIEAARLQLEAVEALGHYKIAIAQAELIGAYARGEHAKAAAREVVIKELKRALTQLQSQKSAIRKQIQKWSRLAERIALVQDGDNITRIGLTQMWQAYAIYQRMATLEINDEIEDVPISENERQRQFYEVIKSTGAVDLEEDVPDDVDNLAALIAWLQDQKNVMPKRGRKPFQLVRDAFLTLAGKRAATEIESLQKLMDDIQQGTLDAWQPVMLAPFLENSAISKLVEVKPDR